MNYLKIITLLLFVWQTGVAQDNIELQKMADDDQQARMKPGIDWVKLNEQDSLRRVRAKSMLDAGDVKTGRDFYNTGIIFQHGGDSVASGIAVDCFKTAIEMDSTLNRWWYAAAVDRDLMRRGKPQIYGTQFISNASTNGKLVRYDLDSTQVTDKERRYYRVETLVEQAVKARTMNLRHVGEYYTTSKSIDQTLALIRSEFDKGQKAEYNVEERVINGFGYWLLNHEKEDDALAVFELNTQLYPDAFNVHDSYGEALKNAGRTKESIAAYQKSLELNPDNENAVDVLQELGVK